MNDLTWKRHGEARVWTCLDKYKSVGTIRQDDVGWFHLYPHHTFFTGEPPIPLTGLRTIHEAQDAATLLLSLELKEKS